MRFYLKKENYRVSANIRRGKLNLNLLAGSSLYLQDQ